MKTKREVTVATQRWSSRAGEGSAQLGPWLLVGLGQGRACPSITAPGSFRPDPNSELRIPQTTWLSLPCGAHSSQPR